MSWFTASIIMSCRLTEGEQDIFPVYENFILLKADTRKEAWQKAKRHGEFNANIDDKTELNGKPAYWSFEGIRKLIEIVDNDFALTEPLDEIEVSYSYMEVDNETDLQDLAAGKRVAVHYIDMDEE